MNTKILGIIGGIGPMATAYFMELIINMTKSSCDQEHMNMIIYNIPSIPDRTQYILNQSNENPMNYLMEIEQQLEKDGAEIVAIPCITAHHWWAELEEKAHIPIINLVYEIRDFLIGKDIHTIGIMATNGTIKAALLQTILQDAGIEMIIPLEEEQKKVTDIVYEQIKANQSVDCVKFHEVVYHLQERGAEKVLLACTELSLVRKHFELEPEILDSMEILAKRCIELCGLSVNDKYK